MIINKMKLRLIISFQLLTTSIMLIKANPLAEDEKITLLNDRLNYFLKRWSMIEQQTPSEFMTSLQELIQQFQETLTVNDAEAKESLIDHYDEKLEENFNAFLQQQLDEQYMNEEINMESWYMQHLMPQLNDRLASEIAELLPKYQLALNANQFDDKYNQFTSIGESFSEELITLIDTQSAPLLNVHLLFFKEFLMYLLEECAADQFKDEVKLLLTNVEKAMSERSLDEKLYILDRFDELETKFGRFLYYKAMDFDLYKFSNLIKD